MAFEPLGSTSGAGVRRTVCDLPNRGSPNGRATDGAPWSSWRGRDSRAWNCCGTASEASIPEGLRDMDVPGQSWSQTNFHLIFLCNSPICCKKVTEKLFVVYLQNIVVYSQKAVL